MTLTETHKRGATPQDEILHRPDKIEARVRGDLNLTGVDLDKKGEFRVGSASIKTSMVEGQNNSKTITNVSYRDGFTFTNGEPKPTATFERTFVNDKIVRLRYAYPDKDLEGNFRTVELVQEVTEEADGAHRQTIPGKVTIYS